MKSNVIRFTITFEYIPWLSQKSMTIVASLAAMGFDAFRCDNRDCDKGERRIAPPPEEDRVY